MSFCASCGRQRVGTSRFCAGCGTEFADDQAAPAADAAAHEPPADATHLDVDPGVTRVEPPTAGPDPFASWYQREPQGVGHDAGSTWQPTQTVTATPAQAAGYPSSGFTPANPVHLRNPGSPARPPCPAVPARPAAVRT